MENSAGFQTDPSDPAQKDLFQEVAGLRRHLLRTPAQHSRRLQSWPWSKEKKKGNTKETSLGEVVSQMMKAENKSHQLQLDFAMLP